ncbi:putative pectinesterase 52 [Tripterygium wilfordii]|uniref:Pectinesterase n=1 Tax=Tripterygium wilfordii TaxID=458696 RepID=A0A7J7D101_TRIWF|nr:putative pectinesterase 52 [Tripterygium wilfordii]
MQLPQFLFILTLFGASFVVSQVIQCQSGIANTIVVDKSGTNGVFNTVQAAIDSIPPNNNNWIRIQINPGIYIEQVTIPENKPCIILEGQDRRVTTITYDAHDKTNTSITFSTNPDYVVVKGITFENSYNHPLKLDTVITQAVAALIGGDKNVFFECGFLGLQDTLWDFQGRHYFYNCYIEGAIDFIFGNGQSYYEVATSH